MAFEPDNIMRMTQISLIVLLLVPAALSAQEQNTAPSAQEQQPAVDINRLPIDVGRIQRELRLSTERNENEGLQLRYFVDVYGQAPPIVIFGPEDNLVEGPVPYGAPTHREMVNQNTPIDYRPMAWDLNSLYRWLSQRMKKNKQ
ncbi:MAG: hypothetical protein ABW318_15460 [Vicinamibacterales bacterium]